jgi:hypothetical protein
MTLVGERIAFLTSPLSRKARNVERDSRVAMGGSRICRWAVLLGLAQRQRGTCGRRATCNLRTDEMRRR